MLRHAGRLVRSATAGASPGTEQGSEWGPVTRAVLEAARGPNPDRVPSVAWFRTSKGRGYGKYDAESHGTPHAHELARVLGRAARPSWRSTAWSTRASTSRRPPTPRSARPRRANLRRRRRRPALAHGRGRARVRPAARGGRLGARRVARLHARRARRARPRSSRTSASTTSAPTRPSCGRSPARRRPTAPRSGNWGAWVNAFAKAEYGRPLFIAASADLAESTNIAGFGKDFGDLPGWGWYERDHEPARDACCPREITEFTNAGMVVGLASVNLADDPFASFNGFWGTCSTYGSFSYLKYGAMRLFSQLAQDAELKVGKVLWVAGHSGPETAEDSRTHFGIFETAVTQLFPEGQVIDLHPWEYNEVPVVLAAALRQAAPIVALHLTRPVHRDPGPRGAGDALALRGGPRCVRDAAVPSRSAAHGHGLRPGTVPTANLVSRSCRELDARGLNVQDRGRAQPAALRAAGRGVPRRDGRGVRPLGRDGHHQRRLQAHARLARGAARRASTPCRPTGTTAGAPAAPSTR